MRLRIEFKVILILKDELLIGIIEKYQEGVVGEVGKRKIREVWYIRSQGKENFKRKIVFNIV